MTPIVFFNGQYLPKDQVRLSPDDRGFLFGDGVYEVTRTYDGKLFLLQQHLERLKYSLSELCIMGVDVGGLAQVSRELLRRNQLERANAIVYIQVTRGAAPRTHAFPRPPVPATVYAYASAVTPKMDPEIGVKVIAAPDLRWARCDIKSIALAANVLANQAAAEAGGAEAILVRDGVALEGSHSSFFAVFGDEVRTAPRSNYILPSITRQWAIDLCAREHIALRETPVFAHQLQKADEMFLAGTTTEIMPIVTLDGWSVGTGRPGPITKRLRAAFIRAIPDCVEA